MDQIKFNISPSALALYNESPLAFYFTYIAKLPPDTTPIQCYGQAGTVVHLIAEKYAIDKSYDIVNNFTLLWQKYNLDSICGLNGKPLERDMYWQACLRVKKLLDEKYFDCKPEEKIVIPALKNDEFKINYKGIVDLPCYDKDKNFLIVDWKSSSSIDHDGYLLQARHYAWSYWKKYGIIPTKCIFEYVKIDDSDVYEFDEIDMHRHEHELEKFLKEIVQKGRDINQYDIGFYEGPFCTHKQKIQMEEHRRFRQEDTNVKKINFLLKLKNNKIYICNKISKLLNLMLKKQFRYEVEGAEYVKEHSAWDGIVRFYDERRQCLDIGFLSRLLKVLEKYCEYKGFEFWYQLDEGYNPDIPLADFKDKLIGIELRSEQDDACKIALKHKACRIQMPTGIGKTVLAAEFIRRHKMKTLFIVDTLDLLKQTKKEFEDVLGIEIGIIGGGEYNPSWVTIGTYQSVIKKCERDYLNNIQCLIVDECQIGAAKSIISIAKKCYNTKHRLGLSATPKHRTDDMLVESQFGRIEYVLKTTVAQDKHYLVDADIHFYHIPLASNEYDWRSDYEYNIINNEVRNSFIQNFALEKAEKGMTTIILTKSVEHGKLLAERIPNSHHIFGEVDKDIREKLWDDLRAKNIKVIVATLKIASKGLNIKSLQYIINAAANGNSEDSIQILGRVLRLFDGKNKGVYVDFIDKGKYSKHWSRVRMNGLTQEGHKLHIHSLK